MCFGGNQRLPAAIQTGRLHGTAQMLATQAQQEGLFTARSSNGTEVI